MIHKYRAWDKKYNRMTNNPKMVFGADKFGFYPAGNWCFNSFEESVARIERWREEEAKGLTDNQALCYYNQGLKNNTCAYLSLSFKDMN